MAGIIGRPRRSAGTGSSGGWRGGALDSRLRALLTGPEPRWARPLLLLGVAGGLVAAVLAALALLAPGVEPRAFEQHSSDSTIDKLDATLVAQSFRSPRDNLSRVEFEGGLVGAVPADGTVSLVEGDGPGGKVLYQLPLSKLSETKGYTLAFNFPPVAASEGMTYTVVLETPGAPLASTASLRFDTFDVLSSGSMYLGDDRQSGDMAFNVKYRYDVPTLIGDVVSAVTRDGWLTLCWLLLLMLPGSVLLAWLPNRLSAGQRFLAAPCLSALALPVFYLLMRSLGIHLGDVAAWVLVLLCAGLLVWKWLKVRGARSQATATRSALRSATSVDLAFWGLFAGVMFVTLVSRLLSLRDAFAGAGLDAYHHTLISEMFVQGGGIPSDYLPYASLASFTYHFGFHSLVATAGWLSGRTSALDMMTLMPLAGQIACALPVPALTVFGWRALGNRWAGLAAGAMAGFVSVLPAFYVNWSRYTQGLGLAVLPVAWVLLLEALRGSSRVSSAGAQSPADGEADAENGGVATSGTPVLTADPQGNFTWRDAGQRSGPYMLAVVGAVGLALTHYRIVMIYAAFAGLYLAWRLYASLRARQALVEVLNPIRRAAIIGVLSVLALLPWLLNLRQNFTTNFVNRDPSETQPYYDLNLTIGPDLLNHWGLLLMIVLSLGGVGWAFRRRDPLPLLPLATWLVLLVWATPFGLADLLSRYWFWIAGLVLLGGWAMTVLRRKPIALVPGVVMLLVPLWPGLFPFTFRLPYAGYLDATTLFQGLWLPLSLPAGYTVAELGRWILSLMKPYPARLRRVWKLYAGGAIGLAMLLGGLASGLALGVMLDTKPYVARADADALAWIRGHLRRDAYVLANPFAFDWDKPPNQSVHGSDAGLWVPLVAAGVRSSVPPPPAYNERPSDPNYINNLRELIRYEPFQDRTPDWKALKAAGITHIYVGSRGGALYLPKLVNVPEVKEVFHEDDVWVFELVK